MSLPPLTLNAWLRFDVVETLLAGLDGVESVLEIGPGTGAVAARLARRYEYVGVEPDPVSCARARARLERAGRGTVLCGDVSALDGHATFDLVCAFEVLEHIEDDVGALRSWRERLGPNGRLILSVPADPDRWGPADAMVGHVRRYDGPSLASVVESAGFADVRVLRYGFPLGDVLELGRHTIARRARTAGSVAERTAASGRRFQPPDAIGWATRLASAPFRLAQRPFLESERGPGLVVLARREG